VNNWGWRVWEGRCPPPSSPCSQAGLPGPTVLRAPSFSWPASRLAAARRWRRNRRRTLLATVQATPVLWLAQPPSLILCTKPRVALECGTSTASTPTSRARPRSEWRALRGLEKTRASKGARSPKGPKPGTPAAGRSGPQHKGRCRRPWGRPWPARAQSPRAPGVGARPAMIRRALVVRSQGLGEAFLGCGHRRHDGWVDGWVGQLRLCKAAPAAGCERLWREVDARQRQLGQSTGF